MVRIQAVHDRRNERLQFSCLTLRGLRTETFNVAPRPAREGRNPQTGETVKIAASKAVWFHAGKAVKDALNPPKGLLARSPPRLKKSALRHESGYDRPSRLIATDG